MYIYTVINILVDSGLVKAFNSKLEQTNHYWIVVCFYE